MAASRGSTETSLLKSNVEDQLNRLLTQLKDVEAMKDDLDDDEYVELKQETIDQLKEFQATLKKMMAGDVTLVDQIGAMQLAIQAAVSDAFHTPEVINMFANKQPTQLRERLGDLQRDVKLGVIAKGDVTQQAVEILVALQQLGEKLSASELYYLEQHRTAALSQFTSASTGVGQAAQSDLEQLAGRQISGAQK
jgi:Beta-catenin-interacting protein ICAT